MNQPLSTTQFFQLCAKLKSKAFQQQPQKYGALGSIHLAGDEARCWFVGFFSVVGNTTTIDGQSFKKSGFASNKKI